MRENPIKRALANGETVVGTMISALRTPEIGPLLEAAGFQFFFIDMEHGSYSLETVADIILAARSGTISPLVRVPAKAPEWLSRPLDAGAEGLLIPQVETREQVEAVIAATKYHPLGRRGMALARIHSRFEPGEPADYIQWANEQILTVIQIESAAAVEHIDDLVSVPGVDVAMMGPNDLSQSLGVPGQTKDPRVIECTRRVIQACQAHGVVAGTHLRSFEGVRPWMEAGMRLVTVSSDIGLILDAGRRLTQEVRDFAAALARHSG